MIECDSNRPLYSFSSHSSPTRGWLDLIRKHELPLGQVTLALRLWQNQRMTDPRRDLTRDALQALPAAVVAVMAAATNDWSTRPDSALTQIGFFLYAFIVMMFRRRFPFETWLIALAAAVISAPLVLRTEPSQVILAFVLYGMLSSNDRMDPIPAAILSYGAALIGAITMDIQLNGGLRIDTFLMPALSVAYGAGLGAVVRAYRRTAVDLAARNSELLALNEIVQREAILAERSRIAREIHDIVAHHVSGIVLHARAGRDALDKDPSNTAARDVLNDISSSGGEALTAMRGLLGILRDGEIETGPQPSIENLRALVDSMSSRGLPTDLEIHGVPIDAPADVQLSTYRIVQEALTNASRHARAQRCNVALSWEPHGIRVTIDDNGVGFAIGVHEGHGMIGIRERASLVGGSVQFGSSPSGGWRVEAVLPCPHNAVATS